MRSIYCSTFGLRNFFVKPNYIYSVKENKDTKEEIYMSQREGFVELGKEKKVCKLVKYLYGLKQAPKH